MKVRQISIQWRPEMSIFASEQFLRTVSTEYGWLGGEDESGNLRCVLPFTIIRKPMFRLARFRVEPFAQGHPLEVWQEKEFLNSVVAHFRSRGVDMIMPATTNTIFRTCPDGAVAADYGSYIVNLRQSEEALWEKIHSKHRNVIRNAMKAGVEIQSGSEHLETAYFMIRDTLKRSSLGFSSIDSFRRLVKALGENVRIFVAQQGGAPQGCAVVPFSAHSAYYVYGGSVPQPATGAMNLLHWEAMRQFRSAGVSRYDFVGVRINPEKGSKQEGLMRFKERFGGTLARGYIWKYCLNRPKYLIYCMAVKLARGGDIVDQERVRKGRPVPDELAKGLATPVPDRVKLI